MGREYLIEILRFGHNMIEVKSMTKDDQRGHLRLATNTSELQNLHDTIWASLDHPDKQGVRRLLFNNNLSFKQSFQKYITAVGEYDVVELVGALDSLLELHAKECYTIGYMDCQRENLRSNSKNRGFSQV